MCLPLGNDQPGVAARVAARGAGLVPSRRRLTRNTLRHAVQAVLEEPRYREAAQRIQQAMAEVDGLSRAADIIEEAFGIRIPSVPGVVQMQESAPIPAATSAV